MTKNFDKIIREDSDSFSCPGCNTDDEEDFQYRPIDGEEFEDMHNEAWNDLWSENGNELILKCKKCNLEFRIVTGVNVAFDYFGEGEQE